MNKSKKYAFTLLTVASLASVGAVPAMAATITAGQATEQSVEKKSKEKKELTDEQKAEMLEKAKTRLASQLEEGKITQEKYDEAMASIEAGKMPKMERGRSGKRPGGEKTSAADSE